MGVDDIYDADAEQERLFAILARWYLSMLRGVHALIGSAFPEVGDFRLDDEATRLVLNEAAERVVLIDTATRTALREQLQEAQRRGYSAFQTANGVPGEDFRGIVGLFGITWKGRAETVALTELAQARAVASLDRYAATGLVDEVEIVEHTDTDEPCARRNGTVVPLSARPLPLHPRCQMGLIPVVREAA
jgi:hypothetical protein